MKRNTYLEVQYQATAADNFNEAPDDWQTYESGAFHGYAWFGLTPNGTPEYTESDAVRSKTTFDAESEYFAGANSSMRLVSSGGRIFNVESVVNRNEANRFLDWVITEING